MAKIIFLAPDNSILEKAKAALNNKHDDIPVLKGLLSEGVVIASALFDSGTEIIITRGGTAAAIRNAGIPLTIVEVTITGFDMIRCVEKAKQHGKVIGVVTFPSMIVGIECLRSIFDVELRLYPITDEAEAELQVSRAIQDGVNVVIGGSITIKSAEKLNCPSVLIESGTEGILQAAEEAKRIVHAQALEKEKAGLFRAVLDYAYEGIISVDSKGYITFFNPIAEQISHLTPSEAVGKPISQIWPKMDLSNVLHSGEDDLGQILTINCVDVLCNKVAIKVNNSVVGAVITFQDVTQIQKMEAKVRSNIYATGHIADLTFSDIVGNSEIIKKTVAVAKDYAITNSSILVIGETGCGKEVFSQAIHNYSRRRQGPFVAINCAALPTHILESELFGYVGGAFTGATPKGKVGLIELAHGGTIFLDEIAEMDYITQGKLLRLLQERKVMRLGSDRVIPVDIRVIAATNKDLSSMVKENKFRSDLYYRLNVLQLRIPPLRERKEDIPLLAQLFISNHDDNFRRPIKLAPSAIAVLTQYDWPGNIRELKNIIERVSAIHKQEVVDASSIEPLLEDTQAPHTHSTDQIPTEPDEIRKALSMAKGKYVEAARLLGIDRTTLWRKMKRLGLK